MIIKIKPLTLSELRAFLFGLFRLHASYMDGEGCSKVNVMTPYHIMGIRSAQFTKKIVGWIHAYNLQI
jgi:hypothetical protein